MLSRLKHKVAFKLAAIIGLSVIIVSTATILVLAPKSEKGLTQYLNISLSNAVNFSEFVYGQPLWLFDYDEISRLNQVVLKNRLIVAVNVFDQKGFIKGAAKQDIENPGDHGTGMAKELKAPFALPEENKHIKMITGNILRNKEIMGRYELFYSGKLIADAIKQFNNDLLAAFILMGAVLILVVFLAVTQFNKPIIELARIAQDFAQNGEHPRDITKKRRKDEIGILFNGVVDMIEQMKNKEEEGLELQMELEESVTRFNDYFTTLREAIEHEDYSKRTVSLMLNDELSLAVNTVLETLESADIAAKNQNWLKDGLSELSRIIAGEQNISQLTSKAIGFLAEYAGAIAGTIFVIDTVANEFYLAASYALVEGEAYEERFKIGEGMTGQAAHEKRTLVFDKVPDNYMRIESSLFDVSPAAIVVIPLVYENEVKGVLELGAMEKFSRVRMDFLESCGERLAVAINAAMFYDQLSVLLEQTVKT